MLYKSRPQPVNSFGSIYDEPQDQFQSKKWEEERKKIQKEEEAKAKEEKKEKLMDSLYKDFLIKIKLKEYLQSENYVDFYNTMIKGQSLKGKSAAPLEDVLNQTEKVLSMYQIETSIVSKNQQDCIAKIIPITGDFHLIKYMGLLLPELQRFPFSFYRGLQARQFAFAANIEPQRTEKMDSFKKRYYNWNFYVEKHTDEQDIANHFLRVVCFQMVQLSHSFHEKWKELSDGAIKSKQSIGSINDIGTIKANSLIHIPPLFQGQVNNTATKSPMQDQFEVFLKLIKNQKEVLEHHDKIVRKKGELLMKLMHKVDPVGINDAFWSQNEKWKKYTAQEMKLHTEKFLTSIRMTGKQSVSSQGAVPALKFNF